MRISKIVAPELNVPKGMIDLGIGQPSMDLLPLDLLAKGAEHQFKQQQNKILAYGLGQGNGYFREVLSDFLGEKYGFGINPDHLYITNGASQGLDFICRQFTQPGDTIFAEDPSYSLALKIFSDRGLNVTGIPLGKNGLNIEILEEKIKTQTPVLLYTIPSFNNPTGFSTSNHRREQLVALSDKYDFFIVADEVYQLLAFTESPPTPMAKFIDSERVISLGSFSKILAPGLRLGWLYTHPRWIKPLVDNGLIESGGGFNPFTSAIIQSVIELGLLESHIEHLKKIYKKRKEALNSTLFKKLGKSAVFNDAKGGFFTWLRFPDDVDTEKLLINASKNGVGYLPGKYFSSQRNLNNFLRLSFAHYDELNLIKGAKRLVEAMP